MESKNHKFPAKRITKCESIWGGRGRERESGRGKWREGKGEGGSEREIEKVKKEGGEKIKKGEARAGSIENRK